MDITMSTINLFLVSVAMCITHMHAAIVEPVIACTDAEGNDLTDCTMIMENQGVVGIKVAVAQDGATNGMYKQLRLFTEPDTSGATQATPGEDFIPINDFLPVPDGMGTAAVTYIVWVTIIDNDAVDGNRAFAVQGEHLNVEAAGTDCTANPAASPPVVCPVTITIIDDDTPATLLPTVSLEESSYYVKEGEMVTVNVVRGDDGGVTPVDVALETQAQVSAVDDDFMLDTATVPVANNAIGQAVISATSDGTDEGGLEVFEISITANAALYNLGTPSSATVYIQDTHDTGDTGSTGDTGDTGTTPNPTYSIEYSDYKASENESPFTFNIKRSATGSVATITFSTRDVSTTTGSDYQTVSSQTVTFDANSDTTEGSVNILSDESTEDPEVFVISIASPSVGNLGAVTEAKVSLYDALSSQSKFFFDRFSYPVMESNNAVDITVRREGDVSQQGRVVLSSSDVDAIAPGDYSTINKQITFQVNEVVKTERVTIANDKVRETAEIFQVTLTQPIGGVISSPGSATVTIKDDDYCFSLESRYYRGSESTTPLSIGVIKSGYLGDSSTTVGFSTSPGTATANSDYSAVSVTLDFARDVTTMYVPDLVLTQDDEYENQEQFSISLSATDESRICEPSTATVMIGSTDPLCTPECRNNGVCTGLNTCLCQSGFTGAICEETQCTVPCQNNGVCTGPNSCVCPSGYTGPTCSEVVCPDNYCVNGGECVTTATSYSCQCPDGFDGSQCENSAGLSNGAIAGITIGAVAGTLTIIVTTLAICMVIQRSTPKPGIGNLGNDLPLRRQVPQPLNANNGILADGTMLTYPYQPGIF